MTYFPIIPGPVPAYANVAIQPQFYEPSRFVISAISKGYTTTVTTSVDHNYVINQQVRLLIPPSFGIIELNEKTAYVVSIPAANQVVLGISSIGFNSYIASSASTPAQIIAIGDINQGAINNFGITNTGTFIPGSFINISPQ